MLQVLDRRHIIFFHQTHYFFFIAFCATLFCSFCPCLVTAQGLSNGQFFTAALAISNSPFPGSTQHAGSSLVISIELSGDGKIPQTAFIPGSTLPTRYEGLELYLVSSQANLNLTVSSGPGLLTQEPGSTVKHLNWPIPTCVPSGSYNLTYYESSCVNNQCFFSITPIPIGIENATGDKGPCSGTNPIQPQPQPASPPPHNPFTNPNVTLTTAFPIPTLNPASPTNSGGPITVTVGSPGQQEPRTVTVTSGVVMTTATIVVMSLETLTFTTSGQVGFSTTRTALTTMTTVMPTNDISTGGFVPVNAALSQPMDIFLILAFAALPLIIHLCP